MRRAGALLSPQRRTFPLRGAEWSERVRVGWLLLSPNAASSQDFVVPLSTGGSFLSVCAKRTEKTPSNRVVGRLLLWFQGRVGEHQINQEKTAAFGTVSRAGRTHQAAAAEQFPL